ncbi:MAG: hypothetical protein JZU58_24555 [Curvibacter lanceolatus]|uniref:hypothetical protein n=1 Tax=Curvibacter lanceolatus TaxID=86182 RepID=UPI0023563A3E|nr:hypothetical protein [Curvibacter lanceolatus]MBV5295520.1 hypothetical protein [Curvibacter lanceolatus]
MNILVPLTITEAMLADCNIAEPAVGEVEWVSGAACALGDRRIRKATHRIYECVKAVAAGRTVLPEVDSEYWLDAGPTARWAAFDTEVSTQGRILSPLTYVLRPGFFNAIACYGLDGATLSVVVKDKPAGTVVFSKTLVLQEDPLDWYDWAFGAIKPLTRCLIRDLVPYPEAELTLSLTAPAGGVVGAGMVVLGDLVPLVNADTWGGTQPGATAEPVTYSYIKTDDYGGTSIKRRRSATDMRFKLILPREQADYVLSVVQRVLDVPAAWIATDAAGFVGLNVFGLGSGSMSYDNAQTATFSGYVKGMV